MTEQGHCWAELQDHMRTRGIQVICKTDCPLAPHGCIHCGAGQDFRVSRDMACTYLLGKRNITDTINEFLKATWPRPSHCTGFQAKQHREDPRQSPPLPWQAFSLQKHPDQQLHCRGMAIAKASCGCTDLPPYTCQTYANMNMHS